MISVLEVYTTIRDLCNKDQKGFVSPRIFNEFAGIAQQIVFNEMFKELSGAKQLRARALDPSGSDSVFRSVKDNLSNFITQVQVESSASPLYINANSFKRPLNSHKLISLRYDTNSEDEIAAWSEVELVYDTEKIPSILNSNLSAPTAAYPVALISNVIELFPSDEDYLASLVITYYRNPASKYAAGSTAVNFGDVDINSGPRFSTQGGEDDDGFFVFNPLASRNFELPEQYKHEVTAEIAKMIGIRLRDPVISGYGNNETAAN